MFDFGLRLRELRELHGLSQEQLGKKVDRSKSVISNYENNIKVPTTDILTKLACIFHVSLDYLVGIDKHEMVAIHGLSDRQKELIQIIVAEFKEKQPKVVGLTERQQKILNGLMQEFSVK